MYLKKYKYLLHFKNIKKSQVNEWNSKIKAKRFRFYFPLKATISLLPMYFLLKCDDLKMIFSIVHSFLNYLLHRKRD